MYKLINASSTNLSTRTSTVRFFIYYLYQNLITNSQTDQEISGTTELIAIEVDSFVLGS